MEKTQTSMDIQSDYGFQKLEWRVQRVGWVVWIGIIVAACLGVLGPGLFSQTKSVARDRSIIVSYDRVVHVHHPTVLEIAFNLEAANGNEFRLMVNDALLASLDIERIDPAPKESSVTDGGMVYAFLTEPGLKSGRVCLHVDYQRAGRVDGAIMLLGHRPALVTQFAFP